MIVGRRRLLLGVVAGGVFAASLGGGVALAHPLGNFSVNHAHALTFGSDRLVDDAVIDVAEIPTAQAAGDIDADGDGTSSPAELAAYGDARCAALLIDVELTVNGAVVHPSITRTSFELLPGSAGLTTSRLECRFETPLTVAGGADVTLVDRFEPDRIGWHEMTATGTDVHLPASPVPTASTTDSLRNYPVDLLSSPLDVRDATFRVEAGAPTGPADGAGGASAATVAGGRQFSGGGPFSSIIDPVTRVFDDLVGRRELTLGVGLLAVALALVLGASHALLPGHGKTVMAAYIAGRQGTSRDAIVVGATVTATHTGGVLVLGLTLTLSSSLAGESVLSWLGIVSGAMIAALGASLLISSARHRPSSFTAGHTHGPGGHTHSYGFSHSRDHSHGHSHDDRSHGDHVHDHGAPSGHAAIRVRGRSDRRSVGDLVEVAPIVGDVAGDGVGTVAVLNRKRNVVVGRTSSPASVRTPVVRTAPVRAEAVTAAPVETFAPVSRRSLIGMGVAGGLVPSPSALVVLLSAIALGRTAFGILLVIGYGLGMAATLTAAGLLLVRVRDRFQGRTSGRVGAIGRRWQRVSPFLTAGLVLVVGLGLAIRSLGQL